MISAKLVIGQKWHLISQNCFIQSSRLDTQVPLKRSCLLSQQFLIKNIIEKSKNISFLLHSRDIWPELVYAEKSWNTVSYILTFNFFQLSANCFLARCLARSISLILLHSLKLAWCIWSVFMVCGLVDFFSFCLP